MPRFSVLNRITSSWTGTVRRFANPRPTPCTYTDYDIPTHWAEYIRGPATSLYTPGRLLMTNIIAANGGMTSQVDLHYGEFADTAFGVNADQHMVVNLSGKVKPKSRMTEFLTRKRAGEVVLNPMEQFSVELTSRTGALKSNCTLYGTRRLSHRHLSLFEQWPIVDLSCPSYGKGRDYGPYALQRPSAHFDHGSDFWYDIWTTPTLAHPMSEEGLRGLGIYLLEHLRALDVDKGLATAVKAEANGKTLDILTAFAELPDTMHSIMGAVREILERFLTTKRRIKSFLRNAAGATTELANVWLQYRYEIMPFVLTIRDGLLVLNKAAIEYQTTRKGTRLETAVDPYGGWSCDPFEVLHRGYLKRRFDASIGVLEQNLSADAFVTWWELQPLSFVVDWVLNIGDLLSSLGSPRGTMQDGSSYSWRFDDTIAFTNPSWVGPPITAKVNFYKLNVLDLDLHLGLNISPSLSWKRWLDAFSLSWLAFKGHYLDNLRKL